MHIQTVRLKNFKAFQDIVLNDIPRFCVLVGANGVGKTTFFDVLGFLKDCLAHNVRHALSKRGGFREVVSRGHESETICIELQIRMDLHGKDRLVTYRLEIGLDGQQPAVFAESLRYKRGRYGAPFYFLNFARGEGEAIIDEGKAFEDDTQLTTEHQKLGSPDILAIKGLGQFQRFHAANAFRDLIENWHVSDFRIHAARGSPDAGQAEHLSTEGDNVALVAQYLAETHPKVFREILNTMARRVPGIKDVVATPTSDGKMSLRFFDEAFANAFIARFVSDGTIKMFAYLILLYDPAPHALLCVEEPENQLYPTLLGELAEEFAAYADRGRQVFVTTHSPEFLDAVPIASIFTLNKRRGATIVGRAVDDVNLAALVEAGDTSGQLWRQGLLMKDQP